MSPTWLALDRRAGQRLLLVRLRLSPPRPSSPRSSTAGGSLVGYAAFFVFGSVLAAWAPVPGLFVAGRIIQGFATGLMLIAAVPPLVLRWPPAKPPRTAVVMNMGIFGATALGPVIGGSAAGTGTWRPLFWIVAGLGALALLFVILTFEDQEPMDRTAPWDPVGISLAGIGTGSCWTPAPTRRRRRS